MVTDVDLVTRLREILGSSDLNTATPASVRRQLEADFGVDLSDKKSFIRDQIDSFLNTNGGLEENPISPKAEEEEDINAHEMTQPKAEAEGDDDGDGSESDEEKGERPVKAKKRGGGFTKVCQLSPQLEKLVGTSQLARTEVVKKMWVYIREKKLQDPQDRRKIVCDELLHSLFRVKSINMFQMNKALTKHIWPLGSGCAKSVKEEDEDEEEDVASGERDVKAEKNEDVEENNEEESEEEVRTLRKRKRKKPTKSTKSGEKTKRKAGGGFTKLCSLSPELQAFTGVTELARTEVVKRLWSYIKEKNLQDPNDKRTIICDESLRSLFPVESINMFQMNKQLTKHIWPLDNPGESAGCSSPERGKQKVKTEGESDEPSEEDEKQKSEDCGHLAPLPLSDALVKFLGNGESSLSRADVVKRLWDYIEENYLQDPTNKRIILCDEKLKELFKVDFFEDASISELLTNHFIKTEQ